LGSFYSFYHSNVGATGAVTTGLSLLRTPVAFGLNSSGGWGNDNPIRQFLRSEAARQCGLSVGSNVKFLTDLEADGGGLFRPNGSRAFDAVVLGHEEYLSQREYSQFMRFVASGGRLVAMDGNTFIARVNYSAGIETLVSGHGWIFNGTVAWKNKTNPFDPANNNWFGGEYCCIRGFAGRLPVLNTSNAIGGALWQAFGTRVFVGQSTGEHEKVTNLTGTSLIATFTETPTLLIAAYTHHYRGGYVVNYGAFGTSSIASDPSVQYFLIEALTADLSERFTQSLPANLAILAYVIMGSVGGAVVLTAIMILRKEAGVPRTMAN